MADARLPARVRGAAGRGSRRSAALAALARRRVRVEPVPIPHDCTDGFLHAFWRRPEAYLDPRVRANISVVRAAARRSASARSSSACARDLDSGAWEAAPRAPAGSLRELDLGYRLLVAAG